jgi:hypothetical protein
MKKLIVLTLFVSLSTITFAQQNQNSASYLDDVSSQMQTSLDEARKAIISSVETYTEQVKIRNAEIALNTFNYKKLVYEQNQKELDRLISTRALPLAIREQLTLVNTDMNEMQKLRTQFQKSIALLNSNGRKQS